MALFGILCIIFVTFSCISTNHVKHEEKNLLKPKIKISCETNKDCDVIGTPGYNCLNNVCVCHSENCQNKDTSINVPVAKIGGACDSSHQCLVARSYCTIKGVCECPHGTISSSSRRSCLKISQYKEECEEDIQCIFFNGICIDNKCMCDKGRHLMHATCYRSEALGNLCQKNEECITEFGICKNHQCRCKSNYVQSASKSICLPKATNISLECSEAIQCRSAFGEDSTCSNGVCKCTELYQLKNSRCVLDTLLGGRCNTHEDCHQPGDGENRLECIIGECKCKPQYTENSGYCVLNAAEKLFKMNNVTKLVPFIFSYILLFTVL